MRQLRFLQDTFTPDFGHQLRNISTMPLRINQANSVFRRLLPNQHHHGIYRISFRFQSGRKQYQKYSSDKHKSVATYALSIAILVGGASYAAVPLYRLYCQVKANSILCDLYLPYKSTSTHVCFWSKATAIYLPCEMWSPMLMNCWTTYLIPMCKPPIPCQICNDREW